MEKLKKVLLVMVVALLLLMLPASVGVWYVGFHNTGINEDFDATVIGQAEARMWKAYYNGNREKVGMECVVLLREQLGLSLMTSTQVGRDLARSAHRFARSRGNFKKTALPGLVKAYTRVGEAVGGTWDPEEVARAELDWWVKRRTPGQNSAESVGASIAHLYALLYGETNPDIEEAGLLRARAAILRDKGRKNADWPAIEALLIQSYETLLRGIK